MTQQHKNSHSSSPHPHLSIDREQAIAQLKILGYQQGEDIVYPRVIVPDSDPRIGTHAQARNLKGLKWAEIERFNQDGYGIYFVVNGGGHSDKDVTHCRAIFCEFDDRPIEDQINFWSDLNLPEPSLQIATRKSVHTYWVFSERIPVEQWRELQTRLLTFTDSDQSLKNPSRVMRLAGAYHIKPGCTPVRCDIIHQSSKRYSYEELSAAIPVPLPSGKPLLQPLPQTEPSLHNDTTPLYQRYEDIQVPVPQSVPLEVCLSKESRSMLESGVSQGGRNTGGAKLARDLIGTAGYLQSIGQRFHGDPRQLLDEYAARCTPPLQTLEVDSIWKSAEKDRPTPSCTADGVEACIKGWYWNNHVKSNQPEQGGNGGSSGSGGGSSFRGSGSNSSGGGSDGSNNYPTASNPYTLVKELMSAGSTPAQLSGELVQLAATTGYQLGGLERLQKEIEAELSKEAVQAEVSLEFVKLVDYRAKDLDLHRLFPDPLASMLLTKADSDRIDPAFPYLYLLPTAGGQMGGHMALLGKEGETPGNDWLEYPMVWTMAVAPPSSGKSQTQRTIMGPIKRVQDRTRANYKKSLKYLEELDKQWQKLSTDQQAQLKDSDRNPNIYREQMPEAPRLYLIEGGSPEGAFKRMGEQGANNGVVLVFDELSRLLALDQYKSNGGDTRQLLLQAWNGPLSLELHRIEDSDSILLNSVCLNLTGGIQPGKVRKLMADPDDGDGLISRILIGTTKTPENFDKWSDTKVAVDEALSGLYEHLRNLHYELRQHAGLPDFDENGQQPTLVLRFSRDAEELWHQWWEELRRGMRAAEHENIALYGYLGKMLSQTLRLALEFHAIELYYESKANPLEVTRQTLERVIYAAKWHIGQFRLLQAATDNVSLPADLAKIHAFALRRGKEISAEQVQNSVFKRTERKPTLASIRQWFAQIAQAGAAALVGVGRNLKMKALALANKVGAAVGIPTSSARNSDNTKKVEGVVVHATGQLVNKKSDNWDNFPNALDAPEVDGSHPLIKNVEEYDHNSSPNCPNCRNDSVELVPSPSAEPVLAESVLSEKQSEDVGDSDILNQLLSEKEMAALHQRLSSCQTLEDAFEFSAALDALPQKQRQQFESSVSQDRWAWLWNLPMADSPGSFLDKTGHPNPPQTTHSAQPTTQRGCPVMSVENVTLVQESVPESELVSVSEKDLVSEPKLVSESESESESQSVSELMSEPEPEPVSELNPELNPELDPESVSEPTLEELKALLLACSSLVQLNKLKRTHRKTITIAYNSMSAEEQSHVDALAALAVPHLVFKYMGDDEIKQGSQRLIKGMLVYLDPKAQVKASAYDAPVWAINGVASGWKRPISVSVSLLLEVVKAVLPDEVGGSQQIGLI